MSLQSGPLSVCGITNAAGVHSFLSNAGIRVVPWCRSVRALIAGTRKTGKWKYEEALRLNIPIINEEDLYKLTIVAPKELWVEKYKPRALQDIIGNADNIVSLQNWLRNWPAQGRGALVSGPPGIGKTSAVHMVCGDAGYDVVEFNASDARSATAMRAIFDDAAHSGAVGMRRCMVMDEVDGMSSGDRGGIGVLAQYIRTCTFPVICIGNDRSGPRLKPLISVCVDIRFSRPVKTTIAKTLVKRVCEPEKIKITSSDLEILCERNGNDIRAILNFLQFSYGAGGRAGAKDDLQRIDAFTAAGRLFGYHGDAAAGPQYNSLDRRINLVFVDHGMVPLMIGEAYAAAAGRGRGSDLDKLTALVAAADKMGHWDLIDTRIMRSQAWSLLPAAASMIVGAAASARGPAPFAIFPSLLGKMSKRGKNRRAVADMCARLRMRGTDLIDSRPLLRAHLFNHSDANKIIKTLDEYNLTRDIMFETLSETVFSGDEKTVNIDSKLKTAVTRIMNKRSDTYVKKIDEEAEIECEDSEEEIDYDV